MSKRVIKTPLRALCFGLSVWLAGCATLATPVDEEALIAARTLDIPAEWQVDADPVRSDGFAGLYADPILSRYLALAAERNFDLEQARLRIVRADAALRLADSRRAVQLDSSAGLSTSDVIDDIDLGETASLGLSASYDPDLFGTLASASDAAEARAGIARADEARLRRTILSGVVSAYVSAIEAELQLAVAEQTLDFLAETERVTRARFEAGDIAGSDLALSELEVQSARASVAEQRFAAADARRALSVLIGGFGDARLDGAPALPGQLPAVSVTGAGLDAAPTTLLPRRFDVQAARLGVVDAAATLESVRADDLPVARLSASFSGSDSLADILNIDDYIASLGASLAYNLLDGGANDARQADAQAALDQALSIYAETLRAALRDVRGSLDQLNALERSLSALRAAEEAADRALSLEQVRFDLGEAILLDVLTVQRRVDGIRSSRLRTERRYLEAVARAHLAAGPA